MLPSEIIFFSESFIPIAQKISEMDKQLDKIEDNLWDSGYYADNTFNNLVKEFCEDIIPDRE